MNSTHHPAPNLRPIYRDESGAEPTRPLLGRLGAHMMTSPVAGANEMEFASEATSPARARDFVERYLNARDLHHVVDAICLVASELVTNAVVHARTPIRVRIEETPFYVELTVYDQAVDLPVMNRANRVGDDDEGGRGLAIVDACSEDWGTCLVGDQAKCTWASFAVRPKPSWAEETDPGLGP